ncbi:DUF2199 domain-containing protein [Nocardia exalbida]|uniref:DUF2199 domain-containing protein n=1 Tax=Nocardia exalbida TaxID=290231 RepID=UPI0035709F90
MAVHRTAHLPTDDPELEDQAHSQPVGVRPTVELEPADHPLAVEQRTGITLARVQAIAERLRHPRDRRPLRDPVRSRRMQLDGPETTAARLSTARQDAGAGG